jgi:hypothetical protein
MEKRNRKQTDRYCPPIKEKDDDKKRKKQKKETLRSFILSKYITGCFRDGCDEYSCNNCNKKVGSNTAQWCQHIVLSCIGVTEEERIEVARKSNLKAVKVWLKENESINEDCIVNIR